MFKILGGIQAKLIAAGVIALGLFAAYLKIGRDAVTRAKAAETEDRLGAVQDQKKDRDDAENSDDRDLIDGVLKRK